MLFPFPDLDLLTADTQSGFILLLTISLVSLAFVQIYDLQNVKANKFIKIK